MRRSLILCLVAITFLGGCAYEGVIVEKNTDPLPLHYSVGVDGSYAFLLRNPAGTTHRQIVTAAVFERYAIGDYFNDLQSGPAGGGMTDAKTTRTATTVRAATEPTVAKVRKHSKSKRATVRKHSTRKKQIARRNQRRAKARKVARRQPAPRIAQVQEAQVLFVNVTRCR